MTRENNSHESFFFNFDGKPVRAHRGDTIATALLANGIYTTRTTFSGSARGPFCMMGACYDCLVELNGVTKQSCMTMAHPDIEVASANPLKNVDRQFSK